MCPKSPVSAVQVAFALIVSDPSENSLLVTLSCIMGCHPMYDLLTCLDMLLILSGLSFACSQNLNPQDVPTINILKTSSADEVSPGQTVDWTIAVENQAGLTPVTAESVQVTQQGFQHSANTFTATVSQASIVQEHLQTLVIFGLGSVEI